LSVARDMSKVGVLSQVADIEGGQVDQYSGMEHKALNPQPVPPLPVHAVNGAVTGNGFLSPLIRLFVPAGSDEPPSPSPALVSASSRNRGLLETIFSIFSPLKNDALTCTKDADCAVSYYCDRGKGTCEKEFITATISPVNATWGDPVTITGYDRTHYHQVCLQLKGPNLPPDGVLLECPASVFSGSDGGYHIQYTWDTSQPLPSGYPKASGVYTLWVYHYDYANYVKVEVNLA
jgi:hypothetical protein